MKLRLERIIKKLSGEEYFFWLSLGFYFFLYFNLSNKTLYLAFFGLAYLYFKRLNDLGESLFLVMVASLPVMVGKLFKFLLIPDRYLAPGVGSVYSYFVITVFLAFLGLLVLWFADRVVFRGGFESRFFERKDWFLLSFLLFGLVSVEMSLSRGVAFLSWLEILQVVVFYFFCKFFLKRRKMRERVVGILSAGVVWESVWAGLQYLKGDVLGRSVELGRTLEQSSLRPIEDLLRFRPPGTFSHPNELAWFLGLLLPLVFALNFRRKSWRMSLVFLIGLVGIGVSLGRSGWVAAFLGMVLVWWFLGKKRGKKVLVPEEFWLLFGLVGLGLGALFLTRLTQLPGAFREGGSWHGRSEILKDYWGVFSRYPFFGVGPEVGIVRVFYRNPRGKLFSWPAKVHNIYVNFLVELGIFSSLVFFVWAGLSLWRGWKKLRKGWGGALEVGILGGLVSFLANGFVQPMFDFGLSYFILFVGLLTYKKK